MVIIKAVNTQGNLYDSSEGKLVNLVYKWEIWNVYFRRLKDTFGVWGVHDNNFQNM